MSLTRKLTNSGTQSLGRSLYLGMLRLTKPAFHSEAWPYINCRPPKMMTTMMFPWVHQLRIQLLIIHLRLLPLSLPLLIHLLYLHPRPRCTIHILHPHDQSVRLGNRLDMAMSGLMPLSPGMLRMTTTRRISKPWRVPIRSIGWLP